LALIACTSSWRACSFFNRSGSSVSGLLDALQRLVQVSICSAARLTLISQPMALYIIVSALLSVSSVSPTVVSFCAGARHRQ